MVPTGRFRHAGTLRLWSGGSNIVSPVSTTLAPWLRSSAAPDRSRMGGSSAPLDKVVTVSATYGAGASVIAPKVAERLGLPFFERLIHDPTTATAASIVERLTAEEGQ